MTRQQYVKKISKLPPSQYYIERGFSEDVLRKFDVVSGKSGSYMDKRSMVPCYDVDGKYLLGITGRTECEEEPRWKHTHKFPSSTNLYGLHLAKEHIQRSRSVILCEGPGNVWKLHMAGIQNCVAIWGCNGFTEAKCYQLDQLGVMRLVLALDNDESGQKASDLIQETYQRSYNIQRVCLPEGVNDVADMSVNTIKEVFNNV